MDPYTLVDRKLGLVCVTNFGKSPNFLDKACLTKTQKSKFFGKVLFCLIFSENSLDMLIWNPFFQKGSDKRKWRKRLLKKFASYCKVLTTQEKRHVAKMLENGESLNDGNRWHQLRFGKQIIKSIFFTLRSKIAFKTVIIKFYYHSYIKFSTSVIKFTIFFTLLNDISKQCILRLLNICCFNKGSELKISV